MIELRARPDGVMRPNDPTLPSQRGMAAKMMVDAAVPWWAIELLDLGDHPDHSRVRSQMRKGARPHVAAAYFWELWADMIDWAQQKPMRRSIEDWIELCWAQTDPKTGETSELGQTIRDAALSSSRSFIAFAGLADDEGHPIVLKDLHVRAIWAMRCSEKPACVLLPYEFGKSYLGSIPVPLMDWAEWCDATEGRIYWNDKLSVKWIRRLMGQVERNERLHKLFPWIRKPKKGDPAYGVWSTKGFAIGGRTLEDKSFESMTANAFSTGNRYSRVGADDWVHTKNATSTLVQDQLWEYLKSGPMTMPQQLTRTSKYGTAWPSFYLCGTLFDRNDVNYRAFQEFRQLGYKALRFDCYTPEGESRWPEYRSTEFLKQKEIELGTRVFNMRCRNIVSGFKSSAFPMEVVRRSEADGTNGKIPHAWCVVPDHTRILIGFDPGSGKIKRDSKNPAFCVYGMRDANPVNQNPAILRDPMSPLPAEDWYHHIIQWGRLEGYTFTRQCDKIVELARFYGCPVAVEDNATQTAYGEYIRSRYPDIQVINHTTNENKRDPRDGVEQFEPLFHNDRVIIHALNAPNNELVNFRNELVGWPTYRYTDIVMALWIAAFQLKLRTHANRPIKIVRHVPEYVQRFGQRRTYSL